MSRIRQGYVAETGAFGMTAQESPLVGDQAPGFSRSPEHGLEFAFPEAEAQYPVLCFFGSAANPLAREAIAAVMARPDLFDDRKACFVGISIDEADRANGRLSDRAPGYRFVWDLDRTISRRYGAVASGGEGSPAAPAPRWVVVDSGRRVLKIIPFEAASSRVREILGLVAALPMIG